MIKACESGVGSRTAAFFTVWAAVWLALTGVACAELKVAGIFQSDMVVQREMPVPVWGWAAPGDMITVEFKGQVKQVVTAPDGTWLVELDPMPSDDRPATLEVRTDNRQSEIRNHKFTNVLVGEVWLCVGQSNMFWQIKQTRNAQQEIAAAQFPAIRHTFGCPWHGADRMKDYRANWQVCSPATVGEFCGVPYYFARELHQALNVPVGVIVVAFGPSLVQSYISRESLATIEFGRQSLARWDEKAAKAASDEERQKVFKEYLHPTAFFNGSIFPLRSMALRGFAWYQGESDGDQNFQQHYRDQMPLLIRDWRRHWGRGDIPFLMVQLPQIGTAQQTSWAYLREGSLHALKTVPHTGMAVTIDTGDPRDVHPPNKQEPGRRLALAALGVAYGRDIVYSGPIFKDARFDENGVTIAFDHIGSGLVVQGETLAGFELAGGDRRFIAAEARIDGAFVVVQAPDGMKPEAVRYGWANHPPCTLYNKEGLPASPFRTDDW